METPNRRDRTVVTQSKAASFRIRTVVVEANADKTRPRVPKSRDCVEEKPMEDIVEDRNRSAERREKT